MINQSRKKLVSNSNRTRLGSVLVDGSHDTNKANPYSFLPTKVSSPVFFNTCFEKNNLKTVIAWFLDQYGEKLTVDLVETFKQVGFHQATRAGVSLGIEDLQIPPQKATLVSQASRKMETVRNTLYAGNLTSVEKSQRLIDTWNQTSEILRQTAVQNFRTSNPVNPVYMMAFSGARGNISQVRQLVAMRGLMADPQGSILEFPIQSNFREGLTITEYLISCYGARKGLVDTALRTATSGYLTRRLVDAVQHVVVHVTDCQTRKGIILKQKNLDQRLIGRVLLKDVFLNRTKIVKKNTLISPKLAKQIASNHQEIFVRSPLTCQTEKSVCQLCYGIDLAQGKLVSIGEAVGIIAAQSIGEPGTQLTMRTFHTGGVGVFSDQALKSFTAPFEGKIEFLEALPGLFVRTPHGNIVYLLKYQTSNETKPLLKLIHSSHLQNTPHQVAGKLVSVEKGKGTSIYEIKQGDVPSGSLLWVKQGEYVKPGQLLIQASRIQTTSQEMPESTHPVRSPLSGEVFFQFMAIRQIEKRKKKSQKNKEKELAPTLRTLMKLGNFWVFSSFIQKHVQISKFFFLKGDLVSRDTPIKQYNLHLPYKGQLKKTDVSLIFCSTGLEFLYSQIQYSNLFYFFFCDSTRSALSSSSSFIDTDSKASTKKPSKSLIVYSTNSKKTVLYWYPNYQQNTVLDYCSVFSSKPHFVKGPESQDLFKSITSQKGDCYETHSILSSCPVFDFNLNSVQFQNSQYYKIQKFWEGNKADLVPTGSFCEQNQPSFEQNIDFPGIQCGDHLFSCSLFSKSGLFQLERAVKPGNFDTKELRKNLFFFQKRKPKVQHFSSFTEKVQFLSKKDSQIQTTDFRKNPLKRKTTENYDMSFVKKGLKKGTETVFVGSKLKMVEKINFWLYFPQTTVKNIWSSSFDGILLEPNKKFENVRFENCYVLTRLLNSQNLVISKLKQKTNRPELRRLSSQLLTTTNQFANKFSFSKTADLHNSPFASVPIHQIFDLDVFSRQSSEKFCFYKKQFSSFQRAYGSHFSFSLKRKYLPLTFLSFQKASYQVLPDTKILKQNWLDAQKLSPVISIKSPLFTKQTKTEFSESEKPSVVFKVLSPQTSGWIFPSQLLKVELQYSSPPTLTKVEHLRDKISLNNQRNNKKGGAPELSILKFTSLFYRPLKLENSTQYSFRTFDNGWVLPNFFISRAFLKSKTLGEFRGLQKRRKDFGISVVRTQDLLSIQLPVNLNFQQNRSSSKENYFLSQVGASVRFGNEIASGYGIAGSGKIIKLTKNRVTVRKGIPLLASSRGLVHITQNDLVNKNDLVVTLRSRRLQTEDIVQGIPKIEQLFEARETQGGEVIQKNMHSLLQTFFKHAQRVKPMREAVQLTLAYIRKFLVENILAAYSNQGVHIAEKHVEVVVRQMTARVRITQGNDSGFLPGEFVQHHFIENLNSELQKLGLRQAEYEPVILGITKSVLQSESFLLAASFQQVSRVLVRSALAKKTDFLRGLHENILVGQPIPAGTGINYPSDLATENPKLLSKRPSTKQFLDESESPFLSESVD
uniref:DNA-directed RNA polymerase n=1 Tax=Chlorella heliozoae TaxID=554066 RepID=A0A2I4S6M9_9CHLO|nr:RNA polymerase beta' subunit [Chlorella heliozoae]AST08697.1 RNA polymerase beta' subunit [Chlorella heliozoae]